MIKLDSFKNVMGKLFINHRADKAGAPELKGYVRIFIGGPKGTQWQRVKVKAWIRMGSGSQPYYALSVSGTTGTLRKEDPKRLKSGADFRGTLGPNEGLEILGKKCTSDDGEAFIAIVISEPSKSGQSQATQG